MSPSDVDKEEGEEDGLGVRLGDGGIEPIPPFDDALAISHATVPGAATAAARHTAPVSWSVGCGFPTLKARAWMSGSWSSLVPSVVGDIAGGQTTATLVCAAFSTDDARPIRTAPTRRIVSMASR